MNIWKRLAIKNLKMNKKRTISTVIGIILSTALICGTATLIASVQKTLVQNAINETGYYHVKLQGLSEEEINQVGHNRDIKETFASEMCGYAKLEKSENEDKPYAKVFSMEESCFQRLNFKMIERKISYERE